MISVKKKRKKQILQSHKTPISFNTLFYNQHPRSTAVTLAEMEDKACICQEVCLGMWFKRGPCPLQFNFLKLADEQRAVTLTFYMTKTQLRLASAKEEIYSLLYKEAQRFLASGMPGSRTYTISAGIILSAPFPLVLV